MIIIVEGPPKTGKTKLAEKIAGKTGANVSRHVIDSHQGNNHAYLSKFVLNDDLEFYDPAGDSHLIFDEYAWVNPVYSKVFGAKKILDSVRWFVEARLRTLGAVVVYTPSTPERVAHRLTTSNPYVLVPERIRQSSADICQVYEDIASASALPVSVYPSYDVGEIAVAATRLALHAATLSQWPSYIGHAVPKALVVDSEARYGFGPCIPYQNTGMRYLLGNLEPKLRDDLGYVNTALMTDDQVLAMYEHLGSPLAVALGADMAKKMTALGIRHVGVPHPKYMRRALPLPGVGDQYGEMIGRAVSEPSCYLTWRPDVTR